jgi:hypothetical protein
VSAIKDAIEKEVEILTALRRTLRSNKTTARAPYPGELTAALTRIARLAAAETLRLVNEEEWCERDVLAAFDDGAGT